MHILCLFFCSFPGWQLGALMCKAAPYLQGVAVCASVNTLAAIALDRYVVQAQTAIPKQAESQRRRASVLVRCGFTSTETESVLAIESQS